MGRKKIDLSCEQVEFIKEFSVKSSHGNKMKLADEFNKKFNLKLSYKTLIKYAENSAKDQECIDHPVNKTIKKCEENKKYYKKNAINLNLKSKAYYKKFQKRILFAKKKKYSESKEYRDKNSEYSKAYFDINKRNRLESFKLSYIKKRPIRLLKAKLLRDRLSNIFL